MNYMKKFSWLTENDKDYVEYLQVKESLSGQIYEFNHIFEKLLLKPKDWMA